MCITNKFAAAHRRPAASPQRSIFSNVSFPYLRGSRYGFFSPSQTCEFTVCTTLRAVSIIAGKGCRFRGGNVGIRAGEKRNAVDVLIEFHKYPLRQIFLPCERGCVDTRGLEFNFSVIIFWAIIVFWGAGLVFFPLEDHNGKIIKENISRSCDIRQQLERKQLNVFFPLWFESSRTQSGWVLHLQKWLFLFFSICI